MADKLNLTFQEETDIFIPAINSKTVKKFEDMLSHYKEREIKFPAGLVSCFLKGQGRIPDRQCFQEPNGDLRMLCRFCTLIEYDEIPTPEVISWRSTEADVRYDYSLDYLMDADPYSGRLDESKGCLVPFAILDTAGHNARSMHDIDLICLDYEASGEPSVVTWSFEESWAKPKATVKVADSFDEFLEMLYERPDDFPCTNECEYF